MAAASVPNQPAPAAPAATPQSGVPSGASVTVAEAAAASRQEIMASSPLPRSSAAVNATDLEPPANRMTQARSELNPDRALSAACDYIAQLSPLIASMVRKLHEHDAAVNKLTRGVELVASVAVNGHQELGDFQTTCKLAVKMVKDDVDAIRTKMDTMAAVLEANDDAVKKAITEIHTAVTAQLTDDGIMQNIVAQTVQAVKGHFDSNSQMRSQFE